MEEGEDPVFIVLETIQEVLGLGLFGTSSLMEKFGQSGIGVTAEQEKGSVAVDPKGETLWS